MMDKKQKDYIHRAVGRYYRHRHTINTAKLQAFLAWAREMGSTDQRLQQIELEIAMRLLTGKE